MNANEKETTLTRAGSAATRKLVLTAMFTCLAFVLNTFVYFPAMAPFQHFVNVLAAALVLFRRKFTLTDARAAAISAELHAKTEKEETYHG